MYLTDYHTHSRLSPDSSAPLPAMADAAVAAGLSELCVTDHVDLLDIQGGPLSSHNWAPKLAQFRDAAPAYEGRLTLRLGLEFGSGHLNPALSEQILSLPQLDFVIGSIHNLSPAAGGVDFYYVDYPDLKACYAALDDYFASMALLAPTGYYDVLGHIIYPLRYMHQEVPLDPYMDRIREILKITVANGKGIEVNTCRGQTIAEWRPILALYKECGGEIITLGSDAHSPQHVGAGIPEACRLLEDCGFRYTAAFQGRKPTFHKLP